MAINCNINRIFVLTAIVPNSPINIKKYAIFDHGVTTVIMWLKQFHKPSPSHHPR